MFSKFSIWVYSMCRFFFFASYSEVATVDPLRDIPKRCSLGTAPGLMWRMAPSMAWSPSPSNARRLGSGPQFGIAQLVRCSDYNKNHTYDTQIMIFRLGYKPTNITGGWSFLWEASKLIDWLTGWPFSESPCLVDTHLPTPDTMQGSIGAMVVLELSED
jgi:hypothetical protein